MHLNPTIQGKIVNSNLHHEVNQHYQLEKEINVMHF